MKVFHLLHRMAARDREQFAGYLRTPMFNRRTDLMRLFDAVNWEAPRRPDPQRTWVAVYRDAPFAQSKWHLLTSRLYKCVEDYLCIQEMRSDVTRPIYLAKAYRRLGVERAFTKTIDHYRGQLDAQPLRDVDYLQALHELAYEEYDYVLSVQRTAATNLQDVADHLDVYFMASKLRQACYALSRSIIRQEKYQLRFVEDVVRRVEEQTELLQHPALAIYYYCYRSISAPATEAEAFFMKLRTAMETFVDRFRPAEMRDIYTIAINYSIRRLNTGTEAYIREAYELYLLSLERGFLVENGVMQDSTYTNLLSLACKQGKYDWARQFVETHRDDLRPLSRTPLYHYCLGKLYYEQGLPDRSLPQLVLVDAKAPFIFLGARILQLKIYYENKDFDPLESLLESLRVYLQRNKNLAYRKAHYVNILTFTRQLLQLPIMSKSERRAFRQRIADAEVLGEKPWFLAMVDQ